MAVMMTLLRPGDEIVSSSSLYGGTHTQFDLTLRTWGVNTIFIDSTDPENYRRALTPRTRAFYGETIGNPRGDVLDIRAVAGIAHEAGLPLIIDNTFATPYLCRPFEHGANIIVHSTTKYIGGHGTTIGVLADGPKAANGALARDLDPELLDAALRGIEEQHIDAASALATVGEQLASTLEALDNPLLAGRAVDVRDATNRALRHLSGQAAPKQDLSNLNQPVILIAQDLTPSDTASLRPETVLGICTTHGGPTAHAAILARALGIPAIAGLNEAVLKAIHTGDELGLDADNGLLYHSPTAEICAQLSRRIIERQQHQAALKIAAQQTQAPIIINGQRISLLANIGSEAEAEAARQWGAEGPGDGPGDASADQGFERHEQFHDRRDRGCQRGRVFPPWLYRPGTVDARDAGRVGRFRYRRAAADEGASTNAQNGVRSHDPGFGGGNDRKRNRGQAMSLAKWDDQRIERMIGMPSPDGVRDLAQQLPIRLISSMFGIPEADHPKFLAWSTALIDGSFVDVGRQTVGVGARMAPSESQDDAFLRSRGLL